MSTAKKVVEISADTQITGAHGEKVQLRRLRTMPRTPWPWPRAVMVIVLLSLALWGGVAGIVSLAFN